MPKVTSFDGTKVYYYKKRPKNGHTIVLVHGWGHNYTVWKKEIAHLHKLGYGILALDLRGHGRSDQPEHIDDYKMECFLKDINAMVRKESLDGYTLVGHSLGGMIVLSYEEMFPKDATSLVLVDTSYENPLKTMMFIDRFPLTKFAEHTLKYILGNKKVQKRHFPEVDFSKMETHSDLYYWLKGCKQATFAAILMSLQDMLEYDEKRILPNISIPTLIIVGVHDRKTPIPVAEYMHKMIKHSTMRLIPHASHDTNIRHPEMINEVMQEFLITLDK